MDNRKVLPFTGFQVIASMSVLCGKDDGFLFLCVLDLLNDCRYRSYCFPGPQRTGTEIYLCICYNKNIDWFYM